MSEDIIKNSTGPLDSIPGFSTPVGDVAQKLVASETSWLPPNADEINERGYDIPAEERITNALNNFNDSQQFQEKWDQELWQNYTFPRLVSRATALIEKGDISVKSDVAELLETGTLRGNSISPPLGKRNQRRSTDKLIRLLEIFEEDPPLARELVQKNIYGFHTTSSGALHGILDAGAILPAKLARQNGASLRSGERIYSAHSDGDDSISFADWMFPDSINSYREEHKGQISLDDLRDRAINAAANTEKYTEVFENGTKNVFAENQKRIAQEAAVTFQFVKDNPDSLEAKLILANFPIAFGLDGSGLPRYENMNVEQDETELRINETWGGDVQGEFTVRGGALSLDKLPVIATTKQWQEPLAKLIKEYGFQDIIIADLDVLSTRHS